jgi:signal transduction histidine kinase
MPSHGYLLPTRGVVFDSDSRTTLAARVDDADREAVSVAGVAREAWRNVATGDATLRTEEAATLFADRSKLLGLLENLLRNSVEHGSTSSRMPSDDSVEHGSTGNRTESGDSVEHGSESSRTRPDHGVVHDAESSGERTDESGVTVRVGAFDGGFYVVDDGPGFDDIDGATELDQWAVDGGPSGLGLTIVAELAAAHGWRVVRRNGDDGGARFDVLSD